MIIQTVIGLILLGIPFFILRNKYNFVFVLTLVLLFHTVVTLALQALHIFSYSTVIGTNLLTILVLFYLYRQSIKSIFSISLAKVDYALVALIAVILLHLGVVHFYYSGLVSDAVSGKYVEIEKSRDYPYPYYVDEWYAIAFIKHSIATQGLPVGNPLTKTDTSFPNFEAATHSLLSELVVLLNLDPTRHFTLLSVGFNTLIVLLLYLILRGRNVHALPACLASLGSLYIISGANLPGLWTLLPFSFGLIGFLSTLFLLSQKYFQQAFVSSIVTLLFYPPLILLLLPTYLVTLATTKISSVEKKRLMVMWAGGAIVAGIVIISFFVASPPTDVHSISDFLSYISSHALLYENFTDGSIPHYPPLTIIPWPIFAAALVGAYFTFKQRRWWLLVPLMLGGGLWLIYSVTPWHVLMGYQRTIIASSLLVSLTAGFGISGMWQYVLRKAAVSVNPVTFTHISLGILFILFVIFLPQYTARTAWQKLTLTNDANGNTFLPAAPANRYLHPDDLRMFENISQQTFLSLPWKGTVIGIATNNFPAATKPGTITINPNLTHNFMKATCKQKKVLAKKHGIAYIYLPEFQCEGFNKQATSSEGLVLYTTPAQ